MLVGRVPPPDGALPGAAHSACGGRSPQAPRLRVRLQWQVQWQAVAWQWQVQWQASALSVVLRASA